MTRHTKAVCYLLAAASVALQAAGQQLSKEGHVEVGPRPCVNRIERCTPPPQLALQPGHALAHLRK